MGNFKNVLPSGQFQRIVLSLLLVGVIVGIVSVLPNEGSVRYRNSEADSANVIENLIKTSSDTDQDEDGLKDWEESLWKTDADNPDSDGDGTKDGEEVAKNRNPNLAGPNDILVSATIPRGSNPEDVTATQNLSEELLAKYIAAKQTGQKPDALTEQQIIQSVLSNPEVLKPPRTYTEAELSITQDNSELALRLYGNAMGAIIAKYPIAAGSEIGILGKAISTQNPKELEKLDPVISQYEKILSETLAVTVPKDILPLHLEFLNSLSAFSTSIKNMKKALSDSVVTLASLSTYKIALSKLEKSFTDFRYFFDRSGVSFKEPETGVYFIGK